MKNSTLLDMKHLALLFLSFKLFKYAFNSDPIPVV